MGAAGATVHEYNRRFFHKVHYLVDIPDGAEQNYKEIVKKGVINLLISDGTYNTEEEARLFVSVEPDDTPDVTRRVLVSVDLDHTNKQIHKGFHLAWFMWRTEENPEKRFQDLQRLAGEQPNRSSVQKALSFILPV